MQQPPISHARSAFTLLEVLISVSLIGLVLANVSMVMRTSSHAFEEGTSRIELDLQAECTLDRIALALMAASKESLRPAQASPLDASDIAFQEKLGVEDGHDVLGDPESIEFEVQNGQVVWKENPDLPPERQVVWTHWVRPFLEGELANGIDDNGNGLVDEKGLSFTLEENGVSIRLTLERPGPNGTLLTRSLWTRVTCRN